MSKDIVLHCGRLYDGITPDLQENMEILVTGNRIAEVGKNVRRPEGCTVYDLSHLTVTPGLIDAHIHAHLMTIERYYQVPLQSDTYLNLAVLHTAQRCLERGFTTVRVHGNGPSNYGIADVKKVIDEHLFPGSRLSVCCHMLGTPGCHFDTSARVKSNPEMSEQRNMSACTGSGPAFFRDAVRKEKKYGADFVKFCVSGGFASTYDDPSDQQISDEEIHAIIDTARGIDIPTTAHVYAPHLMQKLMKFGITGMEHGSLMDEETADMFVKTGTYLVPTFCPYNEAIHIDEAAMAKKAPEFQFKLRKYGKQLREGREIIANSKILLGYGTDFVSVHECYESWYEYQSWMRSGIDPFRILQAATMNNAKILRMDQKIGSIEVGKLADISGWHRDLLTDEDAISECDFVMKDGGVFTPGAHFFTFD